MAGGALFLAVAGPLRAAPESTGDPVGRLRQELLTGRSATAILQERCAAFALADPPVVRALRDPDAHEPAPAKVRRALRASAATPLAFRRVRLVCGDVVLSTADNWYRPDRLTSAMNAALERTDAPFGRVTAPLGFERRTLQSRRDAGPDSVFSLEAVLVDAAGRPFALVREVYRPAVIGTKVPIRRRSAAS